jgi:small conductance mechanosensitive channel
MHFVRDIIHDLFNPDGGLGAIFYGVLFISAASLLATLLRRGVNNLLKRDSHRHIDRTYASFVLQLLQAGIYIYFLVLYTHVIPALHSIATALLAGVSIFSIVFGLAAQNTLGNVIAGLAILLYRPFGVGDTIQVVAPRGSETGVVKGISLGYTDLITTDNRHVMVPNSAIMSQTTVNLTYMTPPVVPFAKLDKSLP